MFLIVVVFCGQQTRLCDVSDVVTTQFQTRDFVCAREVKSSECEHNVAVLVAFEHERVPVFEDDLNDVAINTPVIY